MIETPGTQLLAEEERDALSSPFQSVEVVLAAFPSISQLDPERQADLLTRLRQWLQYLAKDMSALLRMPCTSQPPRQAVVTPGRLWHTDEETFLSRVVGRDDCALWIALPRPFATGLCERFFGAPMGLGEDRSLTNAERSLLKEVVTDWFHSFGGAFGVLLAPGAATDGDAQADDAEGWMRFQCPLRCGNVEGSLRIAFSADTVRRLLGDSAPAPCAPSTPQEINGKIGEVPLQLQAVLGQAELSLDDLAGLRIGDVIKLDRHAEGMIDLKLDQRILFRARAGLTGENVVLEVVSGPKEWNRS